jgi:hypothetical protein
MSNHEPVTVAVTRVVKVGCEEEFEQALHDFVQRLLDWSKASRVTNA